MTNLLLDKIQEKSKKKPLDLRPGQTVRVHQRIKEGDKERVQVYEGLIIAINSGNGTSKTITVRKIVESIGVERIFPVLSPLIEKIEIKKKSKVRRAKLYYMRNLSGKSARLKSKFISTGSESEESEEDMEAAILEAVEAKAQEEQSAEGSSEQSEPTENAAAEETADEAPEEEPKA